MELTDFLTESFITTFSGTLVSVELIVFVTKELPIIKKVPTRIFTFMLALSHLIIVKLASGTINQSIQSYYILFLNAIVISVILCGGYDAIMNKINIISNFNTNSGKNTNIINPESIYEESNVEKSQSSNVDKSKSSKSEKVKKSKNTETGCPDYDKEEWKNKLN